MVRLSATNFAEGVIRSAERMTYTAVNAVLEGDAASARTLRASGSRRSN